MIIKALFQYLHHGARLHGQADTTPQAHVDLFRYMGRWYELARYDTPFEAGLEAVYTDYTLTDGGRIRVRNSGSKINHRERHARGGGYVPKGQNPGLLRLSFIPPYRWFYSDYRILFVDTSYKLALASGADSRYLWLLSRSPFVSTGDFHRLLKEAQIRGFEIDKLHITQHHPQAALPY